MSDDNNTDPGAAEPPAKPPTEPTAAIPPEPPTAPPTEPAAAAPAAPPAPPAPDAPASRRWRPSGSTLLTAGAGAAIGLLVGVVGATAIADHDGPDRDQRGGWTQEQGSRRDGPQERGDEQRDGWDDDDRERPDWGATRPDGGAGQATTGDPGANGSGANGQSGGS